MTDKKPTNKELENQNTELKKQIEFFRLNSSFQNKEKKKRAAELIIANIKLAYLSKEKEKLSEELIIANIALALQAELIIAKEQAEESDQLKTAFLQNISHEI